MLWTRRHAQRVYLLPCADADAGYVLFELSEEKKTFRGSLEIATIQREGRNLTRFVVTVDDRPAYLEVGMLQRLEHKLRLEAKARAKSKPAKRR